ncbi:MAG TPA: helix-turn-helix domain-containing protein [Candidatus Nanoarchaeia archaeon]|nr:helix-turn-helix domain-containing protein [Candidatus Nanoarchaeia archaeon]
MKESLVEKIGIFLLRKGFTVKTLNRTAFDIVARRDTTILLIKILFDANAVSEEFTKSMHNVAAYVGGSPLIIADKAGDKLEDNVVYLRFGIFTLNFRTLCNSIDSKLPFAIRDHSGVNAHLIGTKLRKVREEEGISLNDLARKVGVSKSMVQKYEAGESRISINKALRLYQLLGHSLFEKIDIFGHDKNIMPVGKGDISRKFSDMGFSATEAEKVPFDIIAKKEKELILTKVGDGQQQGLDSLSKLVDADRLAIYLKKKPKNVPAMTKKEFMEFEKAEELIKFLKEFE